MITGALDVALYAHLPGVHPAHTQRFIAFLDNCLQQLGKKVAETKVSQKSSSREGIVGGRYKLRHVLVKSLVANVYIAADKTTGQMVVVKLSNTDNYNFIIEREAKILQRLSHPGIVGYKDHGLRSVPGHDSLAYVVTDYIDGVDLDDMLGFSSGDIDEINPGQRLVLSPGETLCVAYQIITALDHAHQKGIILRDLKPSNIMINRDGEVVLIDFGVAIDRSLEDDKLNYTSNTGTPEYIAPEVHDQEAFFLTKAIDYYSLGVILSELITGKAPFQQKFSLTNEWRHYSFPWEGPIVSRKFLDKVPPPLELLLSSLLERNPHDRLTNATRLQAMIIGLIKHYTPPPLPR